MNRRSPLLPMFLIVLVDVLGFTIVIPLLAFYAEKFGASPLVATTLVSVYAICSLISTPIIGKLSDQHGRKPLLMISQTGTCAGFLVLAFSNSLWMVFVGRILDGLTAGNLSIAQAYISDHTAPENRAKAFGVIGIAFGVGFMFGPALGGSLGALGEHTICYPDFATGGVLCHTTSDTLYLPFLVAAGLSAFSITCTYLLLPKEPGRAVAIDAAADAGPGGRRPSAFDWRIYLDYFGRPGLRALYVQFFLFSFAFSLFMSGFALFSEHNDYLHWTADEVGYLFAYSGLLGILMQGGLLGRLVKRYGEYKLTIFSFIAAAAQYAVVGFAKSAAMLVVAATIGVFGHGILRPVITSRITQAVGRHEQGVAIGISGSLSSVAMALAPPTGGLMLDRHWLTAWAMIAAVVSVIGLLATLVRSGVAPATASAGTDAATELQSGSP
ncbi:MAG TPA: MFS transporter [Kofleriaceae bacterium]|nr:MFS transporter [Kofleriaceae bacterium]